MFVSQSLASLEFFLVKVQAPPFDSSDAHSCALCSSGNARADRGVDCVLCLPDDGDCTGVLLTLLGGGDCNDAWLLSSSSSDGSGVRQLSSSSESEGRVSPGGSLC